MNQLICLSDPAGDPRGQRAGVCGSVAVPVTEKFEQVTCETCRTWIGIGKHRASEALSATLRRRVK